MTEKSDKELKIVDLDVAVRNFQNRMESSEIQEVVPKLYAKKEELEWYVFGEGNAIFWSLVDWYKSVMPLTDREIARGFNKHKADQDDGLGCGEKSDSRQLKTTINNVCKYINEFCKEGYARNELLNRWGSLYEKRLSDKYGVPLVPPSGFNPIVELRDMLKCEVEENGKTITIRDQLVQSVVQRKSKVPATNFFVSYLNNGF